MQYLVDGHGRRISKLRLGLLDACNFRCRYCMPSNPQFMDQERLLSSHEIIRLTDILCQQGIDEVRLTGGEPTLRRNFIEVVEGLSELPLKKLSLTTNGHNLVPLLAKLKHTECKSINFSLDSLSESTFLNVTKVSKLEDVLRSILTAKEMGFVVKINTVVMRGVNDHELEDFVDFSLKHDIEVRFLELMRIGVALNNFDAEFMSAGEMIERLNTKFQLHSREVPLDSTAFCFDVNKRGRIGFIASESRPFCGGCSRLRLSPDGTLRPCLMMNEGISLKHKSAEEIQNILLEVISRKPVDRIGEVLQPMNQIGG